MTATNANGRAPTRKQLFDQLDRLDAMIDTLAEGLNAAVADACREGARAAVREVLMELISNPDLMSAVRTTVVPAQTSNEHELPPLPPPPPPSLPAPQPRPSFWNRVKDTARGATQAVTGAVHTLVKTVERTIQPITDAFRLTGSPRTLVASVVGIGLAAGLVSLVCPVWMSALVAAGGGAVAMSAMYIRATVERVLTRFQTV